VGGLKIPWGAQTHLSGRMLSAARRVFANQLAAASNSLAAPWTGSTRGIIIVKVNDPVLRGAVDKESLEAEIIRAEEMAVAQFNRQVRKEVELGSVHQSGRRMKRLSRFTYPAQARRAAGAARPNASTAKANVLPLPAHMSRLNSSRRRGAQGVSRVQATDGRFDEFRAVPAAAWVKSGILRPSCCETLRRRSTLHGALPLVFFSSTSTPRMSGGSAHSLECCRSPALDGAGSHRGE
jgi:hypothetical protein